MSDIDKLPSLVYLEGLFELLKKNGVATYHYGELVIEFEATAPEFSVQDLNPEVRVPYHDPDEIPVSGVYSDPRLFGSKRVPPFPTPGDGMPPEE